MYFIPINATQNPYPGGGFAQNTTSVQYLNMYKCICGETWEDIWDCGCDDRCPKCNTPITPTSSAPVKD